MISIIAISGVVVGVAALIVVTAVMSGFSQDLRNKIIGNFAHITISAEGGIENPWAVINQLWPIEEIQGASPFVEGQALVRQEKRIFGVKTRGIDPRTVSQVSNIDDYLILGDLKQLDSEGVIVGKELARFLGLGLGSKLSLQVDPRKVHNFTVKGIFSSGMYEYDTELVFLHLNKAKEMLGLSNISGIAVKLNNLDEAVRVKEKIRNLLGYSYFIRTWTELNANFFAALKLEKVAMFVILCLIVLVAAFNIISTLIVMVVQKTKDIGILKALGMSKKRIRVIFTYEGLVIGFIGTGLGIAFGWLLCALLEKYQFIK
ncbi:MAG: ABC transporter permease [Candidatus Omnitrophica bacterium]|nr:ABC transporter permease [Candidatus Omnitrophota bacterium]